MQFVFPKIELHPGALIPGTFMAAISYAIWRRDQQRLHTAVLSFVLWNGAAVTHTAGHVVSAQLAGAPMDRVDWGMLERTLYDNNDVTPAQHIGRAIGGPVASGVATLLCLGAWRSQQGTLAGRFALLAMLYNLLYTAVACLPFSIFDGGVIYPNLRKL